jgi:hypothetical protein
MFRLHERTRLFFCRAGFLILCLGPTCLLAAAAVHYRSPSYLEAQREEWSAVLSDKLGLDVRFARLSYPLWNTALLEELVLQDPETGEDILHARYVEVTLEDGHWQLIAGQPEINASALPQLIDLVNHRLLRGRSLHLAPLHFAARELTFHAAETAQTFQNVHGELKTVEAGKRAEMNFQLAGSSKETPVHLTIERLRGNGGATTTCRLDTAESLLPCGALAPLAPWLKQLGDDATFRGQASLTHSAAGVTAEMKGTIGQVNLGQLVSSCFPQHKLTGLADIGLEQLQLVNGKITEVEGTLQTQGGVVNRGFLLAMRERLELAPDRPLPDEQLISYRHLAFGFRLDGEGLSLSGDANPANPGVIMSGSKAGLLLVEPSRPIAPVAYLVNVLSPESELQIPATQETKSLLNWLPLPEMMPEEESRPRAKNIRIHK